MCLRKRGVFEKEGYVRERGVCVRKRSMCDKEGYV